MYVKAMWTVHLVNKKDLKIINAILNDIASLKKKFKIFYVNFGYILSCNVLWFNLQKRTVEYNQGCGYVFIMLTAESRSGIAC